MNGDWFPWSESANGNQPGEYVAAWRHVHEIFSAAGATDATWPGVPRSTPTRDVGRCKVGFRRWHPGP
ncbi:MAG: hypothetical protein H0X42_02995 [Solirubrobacterales bacterium]|nr:hypothetical protein [Solirubrobacterales bacterium]